MEYEDTGLSPDDVEEVNKFEGSNGQKYLLEIAKHRWIPVSERLPEENDKEFYDMQLVTLKDGEICLGVYRNKDNEWWTRKQEGEKVYTNAHEVIAWQPLPKPHNGGQNERT